MVLDQLVISKDANDLDPLPHTTQRSLPGVVGIMKACDLGVREDVQALEAKRHFFNTVQKALIV